MGLTAPADSTQYVHWDGVVLPLSINDIRVIVGDWFDDTLWPDWVYFYNRAQRGEEPEIKFSTWTEGGYSESSFVPSV